MDLLDWLCPCHPWPWQYIETSHFCCEYCCDYCLLMFILSSRCNSMKGMFPSFFVQHHSILFPWAQEEVCQEQESWLVSLLPTHTIFNSEIDIWIYHTWRCQALVANISRNRKISMIRSASSGRWSLPPTKILRG